MQGATLLGGSYEQPAEVAKGYFTINLQLIFSRFEPRLVLSCDGSARLVYRKISSSATS